VNVARNEVENSAVANTSSETPNPRLRATSVISLVSALPIESAWLPYCSGYIKRV
jgi:hypothetical protein